MAQTNSSLQRWEPIFLSLLRLVVGLLFLEHGTQKLFHFPPADHPMGMHGLTPLMTVAAWLELVGGLLPCARTLHPPGRLCGRGRNGRGLLHGARARQPLPDQEPRRTRHRPLLRLPLPGRRGRRKVKCGCGLERVRRVGYSVMEKNINSQLSPVQKAAFVPAVSVDSRSVPFSRTAFRKLLSAFPRCSVSAK